MTFCNPEKKLLENVVGIHVEVEFLPFYVNQPLFHDIDSFLVEKGFTLIDLNRALFRSANFDRKISSQRQVAWGHALYLKKLDQFNDQSDEAYLKLGVRLLAICLAFEHFDLALQIVKERRLASLLRGKHGDVARDVAAFAHEYTNNKLSRIKSRRHIRDAYAWVFRDWKK